MSSARIGGKERTKISGTAVCWRFPRQNMV